MPTEIPFKYILQFFNKPKNPTEAILRIKMFPKMPEKSSF